MDDLFQDKKALRQLYGPPPDPAAEPSCDFPLGFYELFLQGITRLGIEVLTYRDLFRNSDDWDHRSFFEREFTRWERERDRRKTYLLIQHDVDNHPEFTKRMVAMEAAYGVRSNIFLFRDRFSRSDSNPAYDVDHPFFRQAERHGFVIGYHQNAYMLEGFDPKRARARYRSDVEYLRGHYDVAFVVPHGGLGREVEGRMQHNKDLPIPPELEGTLRWVCNGYGVRFHRRWSDGGLRKIRDAERIRQLDIVGSFLETLPRGKRHFCLVHPQRWGYNVDTEANPLLAAEPWYQEVCRRFTPADAI